MQKHFHTDHRHLFAIIGFNGTLYQQQYLILYVHLTPEFTACLYTGFCITIYRRHNWLQCKWLSKQLLLWLLLCLPACNYSLNRAPYISFSWTQRGGDGVVKSCLPLVFVVVLAALRCCSGLESYIYTHRAFSGLTFASELGYHHCFLANIYITSIYSDKILTLGC